MTFVEQMRKKMRKKAADEEMVDIDALEAAADAETSHIYQSFLIHKLKITRHKAVFGFSHQIWCADAQEDAQEGCR